MTTVPISDGLPKDSYTAAAGQTIFPYTFWVREPAHLKVYVDGNVKTLTSDYTVSAVKQPSGANIVFNSGLTEGNAVVIIGDPEIERTQEYTGTIRLDALNEELTYLTTVAQSVDRKSEDAVRVSDAESLAFDATLPLLTGNASKVLRVNSSLSGFEFVTLADADVVVSNFESQSFDGTGLQTEFALSFTPATSSSLLVEVNGTRQIAGTDYSVVGSTLTFTSAPASGTGNVTALNLAASTSASVPADGSITEAKIVANAVTTTKIADANITTGKIADNAITLDKMEHSNQGELIYYSATGAPARLAPGNAGDVLQSGGTGNNPTWQPQVASIYTGSIIMHAASAAPSGYLECDGSAVSRSTFASLFGVIGTTFGNGDGATTFNLPDLRGEFVRGWDNGRGVDSGRSLGSSQLDQMQTITGSMVNANGAIATTLSGALTGTGANAGALGGGGGGSFPSTVTFDSSNSSGARTGSETRPRNIALMYIIKV